jgi:hypothetical protein
MPKQPTTPEQAISGNVDQSTSNAEVPMQRSESRQRLADTNAAVEKQRENVAQAEQVVVRAKDAVTNANRRLADFGDLDSRILRHRVTALKRGEDSSVLPGELRDQQRERLIAQEEISHAEAILAEVTAELETERQQLESAQRNQSAAAVGIFEEQIQKLLDQHLEAKRVVEQFRILLTSTGVPPFVPTHWAHLSPEQRNLQLHAMLRDAGLPFGSPEDWIQIHGKLMRGLSREVDPNNRHSAEAYEKSTEYWRNFSSALLKDPDADPGLPPVSNELWQSL